MYISFTVESGLTVALLIAAVVACIFMTVLLARLINTIDQINEILASTNSTLNDVRNKVVTTVTSIKSVGDKVESITETGSNAVRTIVEKLPFVK